jgi:hypothetical protein
VKFSLALAALSLTLCLCGVGSAQEGVDFGEEGLDPVEDDDEGFNLALKASLPIGDDETDLKKIYGDDPLFGTKVKLERHLGIYLLRQPQRDERELIEIKGKDVTATVWVSIGGRSQEELACRAVRWLVFGRTQWSLGARGVFSDLQDVARLKLTFLNVRLRDGKNKRKKAEVVPYLTVSISRRDFGKMDVRKLRRALKEGRCIEAARTHLSAYKFDDKYYVRFQDERF